MIARRLSLLTALSLACAACSGLGSGGSTTVTRTAGSGSGGGTSKAGGSAASYHDRGALGAMTRAYLRAAPAKRMKVEVDYVAGRAPANSALSHLSDVLGQVASKPGGIEVRAGNEIPANHGTWTIAQIQALEARERGAHSGGDTATLWIVYLDGSYADGDSTLGIAFDASSIAIFRDRIDDATTALVNEGAIEAAVVTHELGHVLSLVNIGYRSRYDHEDPDHPHHSNDKRSVMYWAVDDTALRSLLSGGPPDEFDQDDKADLAMLKG